MWDWADFWSVLFSYLSQYFSWIISSLSLFSVFSWSQPLSPCLSTLCLSISYFLFYFGGLLLSCCVPWLCYWQIIHFCGFWVPWRWSLWGSRVVFVGVWTSPVAMTACRWTTLLLLSVDAQRATQPRPFVAKFELKLFQLRSISNLLLWRLEAWPSPPLPPRHFALPGEQQVGLNWLASWNKS